MSWPALSVAFMVAHLAGDFLFQTDWQAANKPGGLGRDATSRRALLTHGLTYTVAFVPALIWFADERSALGAVGVGLAVTLPHIAIDHGRAVPLWITHVKNNPLPPPPALAVAVDQSMHAVCLFLLALLATA
jgi:hypothetical protein